MRDFTRNLFRLWLTAAGPILVWSLAVSTEALGQSTVRYASNAATWGGLLLTEGSDVTIPEGVTVIVDTDLPPLGNVSVMGRLDFARRPTSFTAQTLMVMGTNASITAGTKEFPFSSKLSITLTGTDRAAVPGMGGRTLGAMTGGSIKLYGEHPAVSWTMLARSAKAGQGIIYFEKPVMGWKFGDEIIITTSDQDSSHTERRKVARITNGVTPAFPRGFLGAAPATVGAAIWLNKPLSFDHNGEISTYQHDKTGVSHTIDTRAEVGLLTHNIVVQGADDQETANGFGAHTMVMGAGSIGIFEGVEFRNGGQSGIKGRYPVHWHDIGDGADSSITACSIHDSNNRFWSIHKTKNVRATDNVAYNCLGHGFILEDGKEIRNVLTHNLGAGVKVPPAEKRLLISDQKPAVYWATNPNNDFIDNAAAGGDPSGIGFWFDVPEKIAQGTISTDDSYSPKEQPLGVFKGNRAHGFPGSLDGRADMGGWGLGVEILRNPGTGLFGDGSEFLFDDFTAFDCGINVYSGLLLNILTLQNAKLSGYMLNFKGSVLFKDSIAVAATQDPSSPAVLQYDGIFVGENSVFNGFTKGVLATTQFWEASSGGWLNNCSMQNSYVVPPNLLPASKFALLIDDSTDIFKNGSPGAFLNQPYTRDADSRPAGHGRGVHPLDTETYWHPGFFGKLSIYAPTHSGILIRQEGASTWSQLLNYRDPHNSSGYLQCGRNYELRPKDGVMDLYAIWATHDSETKRLQSYMPAPSFITFSTPLPDREIRSVDYARQTMTQSQFDAAGFSTWFVDSDRVRFKVRTDISTGIFINYK